MDNYDKKSSVEDIGVEDTLSTKDDEIDSSESKEQSSGKNHNNESEENGELFEDGYDLQTHGGGELEEVEGFNITDALIKGIGSTELVAIEHELWALPRSCDLEYGDQPETVCGDDDRVRMTAISHIPWRMICQLIVIMADGRKSRCTGWFISPRTVMTAGHCVYSHSGVGGWAQSIEVIPGMNERAKPFGSATGASFRSVKGWTENSKPTHDYGCIILPKSSPLGNKTGWFGFAKLSDSKLKNLLANNSGYPGDKLFGTQWFNAGRVGDVSSRRFEYMLDSAGGQSGSPTWRVSRGKRHAIGIHAYGGCPNKSTRINSPVFNNMQKWKRMGL
jgi:V8-like Glu-specific endopeptidase